MTVQIGNIIIEAVKPHLFDEKDGRFVAKKNIDFGAVSNAIEGTGIAMDEQIASLKFSYDRRSATVHTFLNDLRKLLNGKKGASVSTLAHYLNVANRPIAPIIVGDQKPTALAR